MWCANKWQQTIWQFVIVNNKLMSVFHASILLLTTNFITTLSTESSQWIQSAIALWIPSYLTTFWQNSWSITGQMYEKLTSICYNYFIIPPCSPADDIISIANNTVSCCVSFCSHVAAPEPNIFPALQIRQHIFKENLPAQPHPSDSTWQPLEHYTSSYQASNPTLSVHW